MQANTFAGSSRSDYQMVLKSLGIKYPSSAVSSYGPKNGSQLKISNDQGCFVPGEYRVNPYRVGCQQFVSEGDVNLHASWEDSTYRHTASAAGKMLTQFLYTNCTQPSIALYEKYRKLAVTKAYAKLGRAQLQLGVELGELRETAHMLHDPLNSLHNLLEAKAQKGYQTLGKLIRYRDTGSYGTIQRGRKSIDAATDSWMELRYGLRPLLKSLSEAYDFLMNGHAVLASKAIRSVRSRLGALEGEVTRVETVQADALQVWRIPVTIRTVDTVDALGVVLYRQDADVGMLSTLGLDTRYLPETAWELASRSFVWDWFIGIGDSIRLLRQTPEITVLGSTGSIKITREVTCTAGQAWIASYPKAVCSVQATGVSRYILFDRAINQLPSYIPIFRGTQNLDFFKMIDLIAMKHTDIKKRVRKYLISY